MMVTPRSTLYFLRDNRETIKPGEWFVFDGQSIPIWLWWMLGMSPFTGKSREAAAIHDWLCFLQDRPYQDAHRVMYEIMRSRGMWFRGPIMYGVLLLFGSRW